MNKQLPLFALNMVVFPGEGLNLHIFEPRYKDLINDCLKDKINFGIPSHVLNTIEYGTEVKITEVVKVYEDGRMDISTKGERVFKVTNYQNPGKDKTYALGEIEYLKITNDADPELNLQLISLCEQLYMWLNLEVDFDPLNPNILEEVIHKVGLKPDEEYYILCNSSVPEQQQYVIDHLNKLIPALERAEKAKERIRMNGNFQNLDPFKF